jgi:hypothetical protein
MEQNQESKKENDYTSNYVTLKEEEVKFVDGLDRQNKDFKIKK